MSLHQEMIIEDQTEKEQAKDPLTVNLPPAPAPKRSYANVASAHPGPADSAHPPRPENTAATSTGPPDAQPFHVLDRSQLWTATQTPQQACLNNDASTTLHFPRYLDVTGRDVINALDDLEFEHPAVKAVRQVSPGIFCVTFDSPRTKQRFQTHFGFTVKGYTPFIREARVPPVYVSIRNASPELPDAAVIARLRCFGDVLSFRRCLHRETNIENGFRTARMRIKTVIPSFIRLASETLHIVYDGQPRTCKRCHRAGHEGRDCNLYACFNCDEVGHVASACALPTACSICKSTAHKAHACPFAIIDNLAPTSSISESLAAALNVVPVIPSVTPTETSQTQDEEFNLTEASDLRPENITTAQPEITTDPCPVPAATAEGRHSSSHTGETAILSTAGHSATASAPPPPSAASATQPSTAQPPTESATPSAKTSAAKSNAKQPSISSQPLFKKPDPPAPKMPTVFTFGADATSIKAKAAATKERLRRITSHLDGKPSTPESLQDFPDNVSVASSKRKASVRSSSSEEPSQFVRRRTSPAAVPHGKGKRAAKKGKVST